MKILTTISVGLFVTFCCEDSSLLEKIKQDNVLRVVTRNSPTTYYEGADGPTGFEYDLARRFAEELGVRLEVSAADNPIAIIAAITQGDAHLAAGLTITPRRRTLVRFGPEYQEVVEQLVYRKGKQRPRSPADLSGKLVHVAAGSSHVGTLRNLHAEVPDISWSEKENLDSGEMLALVWEHEVDYTVAHSNLVTITQQYYPELRVAFDFDTERRLAWAFSPHGDDSLYREAVRFFNKIRANGELDRLYERHYGHVKSFDYVSVRTLLSHIDTRLPIYRDDFVSAAESTELDWRLLASIGYQESHWDPQAVSPTGVKGIMMLTSRTAKQMSVEDRVDPKQSIDGGARYLVRVRDKIPERIQEPDRTWLALAAYNIGFGHLEDARKLTQRQGDDADKWYDVKKYLPLLSKQKWHKKTRHGYARGNEAVRYVENVRRYFDVLVWSDRKRAAPRSSDTTLAVPVF